MKLEITPELFKKWRLKKGYTQAQMAELLAMDKYAVSNIERGRRRLSWAEKFLLGMYMKGDLKTKE